MFSKKIQLKSYGSALLEFYIYDFLMFLANIKHGLSGEQLSNLAQAS